MFFVFKILYRSALKNDGTKLKFATFTTDFEKALFNAFDKILNINKKKIKHVGCYFHYIQNIRKFLQKSGFTGKEFKEIYDNKMTKIFLEELYRYFEETWKPYFDNETLNLNEISIKFRTNNSFLDFQ